LNDILKSREFIPRLVKSMTKNNFLILGIFLGLFVLLACKPNDTAPLSETENTISRQEARDDSLELVAAYARQALIKNSVPSSLETEAVSSAASLDAADDPALWIHPTEPEQSIIIGSNKKGGLHLYNLEGRELAYFPVGNINNVDVLNDFPLGYQTISLVGGSNRSDQSIDLFSLDPDGPQLEDVADGDLAIDTTKIDDIYGFCFFRSEQTGRSYAFVNGKNGRLQQFELLATESAKVSIRLVREVQFDSQVEGMVADNLYGKLYVGEEDGGIWKLSAEPEGGDAKTLLEMSTESNPNISFDIEGLTLYEKGDDGYLIASSQGNFSYAVFERQDSNAYVTSFVIQANEAVDGVEETDGIEAVSAPLGSAFPQGIFMAQDGFNHEGDSLAAQNFKVVDWREIAVHL
jgi:3-phytase